MSAKRILVVDDSERVLVEIRDMLESAGFEVLAASSALEANKMIYQERKPDLILLDVIMPYMSGDRKVEFLKERSSSREIPVVLMSVKPLDELREIAAASGADGYINKPFDQAALVAAVNRYL